MLYRIFVTLLRFILAFVLIVYLVRLAHRWLIGISTRRRNVGGESRRGSEERYGRLTDQEIDDAEYEELETGGR
jgi:hypothetical protein